MTSESLVNKSPRSPLRLVTVDVVSANADTSAEPVHVVVVEAAGGSTAADVVIVDAAASAELIKDDTNASIVAILVVAAAVAIAVGLAASSSQSSPVPARSRPVRSKISSVNELSVRSSPLRMSLRKPSMMRALLSFLKRFTCLLV